MPCSMLKRVRPVRRVSCAGEPAVLVGAGGGLVAGGACQSVQVSPALVGQSLLHPPHLLFGRLYEPFTD